MNDEEDVAVRAGRGQVLREEWGQRMIQWRWVARAGVLDRPQALPSPADCQHDGCPAGGVTVLPNIPQVLAVSLWGSPSLPVQDLTGSPEERSQMGLGGGVGHPFSGRTAVGSTGQA